MERHSRSKAIALISGGIDSPLAAFLISKELDVIPLHFNLYPFYCENSSKLAVKIIGSLQSLIQFEKLLVFPFGSILREISKVKDFPAYRCVVCRKSMYMIADKLCEREGAKAIVTGEVLGQKASQTLSNLYAMNKGIKHTIYRPLLCYDKEEIILKAKKSKIWNEKHVGCCTMTPINPMTRASMDMIENIIQSLDLDRSIEKLLSKVMVIKNFGNPDLELNLLSYIYNGQPLEI